MMKELLLVLVICTAFLVGCVEQPPPPLTNETGNVSDQPDDIPMPNETDLENAEPPKFPF